MPFKGTCQRRWIWALCHSLLSEDHMILEVCRCKFSQQNDDFLRYFLIPRSKLRLAIWLRFKVEKVCDISILMYNLFGWTILFTCEESKLTVYYVHLLFFYPLWLMNIYHLSSPSLHNLVSFLHLNYAFAMLCWLILTVIQYLSHYFSSRIVSR